MADCLTPDEVKQITRKKWASTQKRELLHMGITFTEHADGSPAVDRQHYNQVMGVTNTQDTSRRSKQPNWNAING